MCTIAYKTLGTATAAVRLHTHTHTKVRTHTQKYTRTHKYTHAQARTYMTVFTFVYVLVYKIIGGTTGQLFGRFGVFVVDAALLVFPVARSLYPATPGTTWFTTLYPACSTYLPPTYVIRTKICLHGRVASSDRLSADRDPRRPADAMAFLREDRSSYGSLESRRTRNDVRSRFTA